MNAEVSAMHPATYASPTPAAIQELLDGDGHFTPAHAQTEIAGARGEPQTPCDDLESTFALPPPVAWPRLAADPAVIHHPSRANPDAETGYDIAGLSVHNAYHLGQITLLRRMLGAWPPAGRDDW